MDRDRLGTLIKSRRDALHVSLRDVASASGGAVAHSTLGHIEQGTNNTTVDTLAEIARALDAHWDVRLVGGVAAPDDLRMELIDRLCGLVDRLSDRDVRHLLGQIAFLEAELRAQGETRK